MRVLLSEEEEEPEADMATASEPAAASVRKERPVNQEKHETQRKPKQKGTFSSLLQKQTMHRKAPSDKGKSQKGAVSSASDELFRHTLRLTCCIRTLAYLLHCRRQSYGERKEEIALQLRFCSGGGRQRKTEELP